MENALSTLLNKTLLLINPGFPNKEFILSRMKELGVRVIAMHREELTWARPYVDQWVLVNQGKKGKGAIGVVSDFLQEHSDICISGALTFWEEEVPLLADLCNAFGWIGNSQETAMHTRSKFAMQDVLREKGRPSIPQALLRTKGDLITAMHAVGFPAVLKPLFGSDSHYVMYVTTAEEASRAYDDALRSYEHPYELLYTYDKGLFVYQKYIEGKEFSVECFCQNGIPRVVGMHEKTPMRMPFFLETGDCCPPRISEVLMKALMDEAKATLVALGVRDSLAHVELKLTKGGPQVIEIASRMGGSDIYKNISEVYGFDLIKAACEIASGIEVQDSPSPVPLQYVLSHVFIPEKSGVITAMTGHEHWSTDVSVNTYYLSKKPGDSVMVPPEGYERIGWICMKGRTRLEAERALKDVCRKFTYTVNSPVSSGASSVP